MHTRVRHARFAVFALFLTNGALFANLVPRYPEIKDIFGLSTSLYGVTVAIFPLGALCAGPLAGRVMRRLGSAKTAAWGTIGVGVSLIGVGVLTGIRAWLGDLNTNGGVAGTSPDGATLTTVESFIVQALFMAALFIAGGLDAVTDVGQNGHGLRVQRVLGRPIINSFHAGWSIGAVIGGTIGSMAIALKIPLYLHLIVAATFFVMVGQVAYRHCLPGPDPLMGQRDPVELLDASGEHTRVDAQANGVPNQHVSASPSPAEEPVNEAGTESELRIRTASLPPALVIGVLTLLAIAGMLVEDAAQTWTTLYMRDYLGVVGGFAGSAYVLALASQMVGRFSADKQMQIFGPRRTLICGGVLITVGMSIAVVFPSVFTTVIGMCLAGFGCASTVPIAMNAADDIPGLQPGSGLTIVSWLGRLAFLGAPPFVGYLVEHTSLITAMMVVPVAGLLTLLSALVILGRPTRNSGVRPRIEDTAA